MKYKLDESDLAGILQLYRRWVADGRPPYTGSYYPKGVKPQYYYDTYHDAMKEEPDGTFSFNVQTFDSPDGDTWVRGRFRLNGENIEILEQSAYAN